MSTKIEEKTQELCEAIHHCSSQMIAIRKRIDTFLADTSARGAYET